MILAVKHLNIFYNLNLKTFTYLETDLRLMDYSRRKIKERFNLSLYIAFYNHLLVLFERFDNNIFLNVMLRNYINIINPL